MLNLTNLRALLDFSKKKNSQSIWSSLCDNALRDLQMALTDNRFLGHYNSILPVYLAHETRHFYFAINASRSGIHTVLYNVYDDKIQKPIDYALRSLSDVQGKYSQNDSEALGMLFMIEACNNYLYGKHFTLVMDQKPLLKLFGQQDAFPIIASNIIHR